MTDVERDRIEREFHAEMLKIYERARDEVDYVANRFLHMVGDKGGLEAAKALLESPEVSTGFTELFMRGERLDLTVEYLVLQDPWNQLFEEDHLAEARRRLQGLDFPLPHSARRNETSS